MLTRWFKRALAECLTLGKSENPRSLTNVSISYDPNILVKSYLAISEIQLGRGIGSPSYDNYCLEIPEVVLTDLDIVVSEVEDRIEISISGSHYYETNSYVNEMGLVGLFKGSKVLFDKTKVDPRIDISTGQTLMITYKIVF
jgi:hypothetical protein